MRGAFTLDQCDTGGNWMMEYSILTSTLDIEPYHQIQL